VRKRSAETALDRLVRRIDDRIQADRHRPRGIRYTQSGLAEHIGIKKSSLSELLHGETAKRGALARLDDIADYFNLPPSLLIHKNDTAQIEVTPQEYRLLAHYRRHPASVRERIMELFDYFAGLLPEEQEARRWWHRVQLIRDPSVRRAIDHRIEEALRAQRNEPGVDNPVVAQESSIEKDGSIQSQARKDERESTTDRRGRRSP
jgi:transcriptional regulator with XRE-family HTH domain